MANITITIEDDLLLKARVRAAEHGTSVNAVLRESLREWVGGDERRAQAVLALINRSKAARSGRGDRTWTRESLHER